MGDLATRIGDTIRSLRKERRISQDELGERSGLHGKYIGEIERGEKNLTVDSLKKLTSALGTTLEQFFCHIDPANEQSSAILFDIISRVSNLSEDEQRKTLSFLDVFFNS